MVGDFIIRKHSARTLALLVRSPAHPGRARGLCGVAVAPNPHAPFGRTRWNARTAPATLAPAHAPLVARGDARTADARLAFAHAPVGRTRGRSHG